ncbi:MAG: MFS transporter [Eubacterium sp.]|nr:MFS transporter [Eubacterium sp.]MCM1304843.1 MFS transporter [Butyrivibrio sp.]MCM1344866.1 MFS transporter [Muribaculaceae bacterium]MCM1411769.1 MFS transporter [Lachnospiraceae bacterium]
MTTGNKTSILDKPFLDSRIKSANTKKSEAWLGYFGGPCLVYMAYFAIAGTYLTQFYTDVLGVAGIFMTLMPVFSKVVDAVTNIIMGRIIDRTRTKQGKARPWILVSGFAMTLAGILLYTVPRASRTVQLVWIVVSYNLFFAFAFTIYNMAHALMVPLSTRNTKQRDTLALLTSTGTAMIPGVLVTIILPVIINAIGVGAEAQGTWITVMSCLSCLAIPATLLEYYFTKERVTEDSMNAAGDKDGEVISFGKQLKACLKDPYWIIIMGFFLLYQIFNFLSTNSMIYYCNWVLGNSVQSGTANQVLVNMIGQAPLGIGLVLLWPLVRKFGKRRVMMFGFGIAALGSLVVLLFPSNMGAVLGGLVIKSFGALPTYVTSAMLAEALDHIEWKNGYRADGFSASVQSIIITVSGGIGQSLILGGISLFGYIAPNSNTEVITQPAAMQNFFTWCFVGIPMIGYAIGSLLMLRFDVETKMPQIAADITARHKAEAEARGETYLSPEEKAAIEQKEQERISEEKRIEELKAKCAKKGLNFEAEEAKYQEKLAAKAAKKKK